VNPVNTVGAGHADRSKLWLGQSLEDAESFNEVSIIADLNISEKDLNNPIHFQLQKGAINRSIVRFYTLINNEEILLHEVIRQGSVPDDTDLNRYDFSFAPLVLKDVLTLSEIATPQTPEEKTPLQIIESLDERWVKAGYLEDYRKTGEAVRKEITVNNETFEAVGLRVGMTELWVDLDYVNSTFEFYWGGPKNEGDVIIPVISTDNWEERAAIFGGIPHSFNLGFRKDMDAYLEFMAQNIDTNPDAGKYTISEYVQVDGKPNTYKGREITPQINGFLPIRYILRKPIMDYEEAIEKEIYGGTEKSPYNLPYYYTGWMGLFVSPDGELSLVKSEYINRGNIGSVKGSDAVLSLTSLNTLAAYQSARKWHAGIIYPWPDIFTFSRDDIITWKPGNVYYDPVFVWGNP